MNEKLAALYEKYAGARFDKVVFFPGGAKTTDFGHDCTFGAYRWHNAIDRASASKPLHVPFDAQSTEWQAPAKVGSFGTMLILRCDEIDAEVRIAHLDPATCRSAFLGLVTGHEAVPAGAVIGLNGGIGVGTGPHAHTEIVSIGRVSHVIEEHLNVVDPADLHDLPYDEGDVASYAELKGMDPDCAVRTWREEYKRRGVHWGNEWKCVRRDYLDGRVKTFYNSWLAFGF